MGEKEDQLIQLSGQPCLICRTPIAFAPDGTWCAKCGSAFHVDCIEFRQGVCPNCQCKYIPPDLELLRVAHGLAPSAEPRRGRSIGALIEIVAGCAFVLSPLFVFLLGGFLARMVLSGSGSLVLLPFTLVLVVVGVALVVDGEQAYRKPFRS
jgi:hypothetical protein